MLLISRTCSPVRQKVPSDVHARTQRESVFVPSERERECVCVRKERERERVCVCVRSHMHI
jgi:hypothetical protein